MAITERDEELIEYGFVKAFLPGLPQNKETAEKAIVAWKQLIELMKRENNYSDQLGSSVLDWQIGNMQAIQNYFMKTLCEILLMRMLIWEMWEKHMSYIENI